MKRIILSALIIAALCAFNASAQEMHYDPMSRNLIFVEGNADITVPTNMFKLTFDFDIQKGSFLEASTESDRIISEIDKVVKNLNLPDVEIIKGWDVIKQASISIGQSGKKLSNKITIKVTNYPGDKLHDLISKIIDGCLAINKDIYFTNIEVGLSDDVENQKREEVLINALRKLKSNAEKAAETQGVKIAEAKRIFVTQTNEIGERYVAMDSAVRGELYEEQSVRSMTKIASIQKGFVVRSQVSDHVKIAAKVAGVYEVK